MNKKAEKKQESRKKRQKKIFYVLLIIFIIIFSYLFFPVDDDTIKNKFFSLVGFLGFSFLVLGVTLVISVRKNKGSKLKTFLMLTGVSAIGPFLFALLYNFFYAMAIVFPDFSCLFNGLHTGSFILSIIIFPILFVVGVVGTLILWNKQKKAK